jgi:hypothetical protein
MTGMGQPATGCGGGGGWGGLEPSVVARPEVVLEGLDPEVDEWREIEFRWKPGDLDTAPRFVAPYQPRLDWQVGQLP